MKSVTMLSLVLMISLNAFCQTLTYSNAGVALGDAYVTYSADTTGVQIGASGDGVTWDFSSLQIGSAPTTQYGVAPSTCPNSSSFPAATVAMQSSGGAYAYFKSDATEYTLLGTFYGSTLVVNSDPEKMYLYPMTYGTTFSDNFAATYMNGPITVQRTGTCTTTVDGRGTLLINGKTYYNVLRVRLVRHYEDNMSGTVMISDLTSTIWYDCVHKTPLLNIIHSAQGVTGFMTYSKSVSVSDNVVIGIDDNEMNAFTNFSVFPNPITEGTLHLKASLSEVFNEPVHVQMMDISGRVVFETVLQPTMSDGVVEGIDISNIPQGVYCVSLISGYSKVTERVIVL